MSQKRSNLAEIQKHRVSRSAKISREIVALLNKRALVIRGLKPVRIQVCTTRAAKSLARVDGTTRAAL